MTTEKIGMTFERAEEPGVAWEATEHVGSQVTLLRSGARRLYVRTAALGTWKLRECRARETIGEVTA